MSHNSTSWGKLVSLSFYCCKWCFDWMNASDVTHWLSPVCFVQQLSLGLLQALLVHLHLTHDHTRVLVWVLPHGAERYSPVVRDAFSFFHWSMWRFTAGGLEFHTLGCFRVLFQDRAGHLCVLCRRIECDGSWRDAWLCWGKLSLDWLKNLFLAQHWAGGKNLELTTFPNYVL